MPIERMSITLEPHLYGGSHESQLTLRTKVNGQEHGVTQIVYVDNDFESRADYYFQRMMEEMKRVMKEKVNN